MRCAAGARHPAGSIDGSGAAGVSRISFPAGNEAGRAAALGCQNVGWKMGVFSLGSAAPPNLVRVAPPADRLRFGLLALLTSENLGDEIQAIAARRFLPRVDMVLDRDLPADSLGEAQTPIAVIANGWFSHRPEGWPPPSCVFPLPISMHLSAEIVPDVGKLRLDAASTFVADGASRYLKQFGPVGGRDLHTTKLLADAGVDAYMSGCLTLTFDRDDAVEREDYVACVDVPNDAVEALRRRTRRPIVELSHSYRGGTQEERTARAEHLLDIYQRAHCVVTTRLHCSLPCLALQTPVLLIDVAADRYRFSGLDSLLHHCTLDEFVGAEDGFDIETPPPNELDYLKYRNLLVRRVREFVAAACRLELRQHFDDIALLQSRYNTVWAQCAALVQRCDCYRDQLTKSQHEAIELKRLLEQAAADLAKARDQLRQSTRERAGLRRDVGKPQEQGQRRLFPLLRTLLDGMHGKERAIAAENRAGRGSAADGDRILVGQSGLFDGAWYVAQNPDVASSGIEPLDHFMRYGWREGRKPSPQFEAGWYLRENPDVAAAGVNPLVHYLRHGQKEGRKPFPESGTDAGDAPAGGR
ncbi:MAG: polysaccharide pyruvyl transferase family protein [Rhodospirillaceae bacterium]|nr:polysaccharide pyruvyl transferase family protein [Rhodospirillaceae bacterium]